MQRHRIYLAMLVFISQASYCTPNYSSESLITPVLLASPSPTPMPPPMPQTVRIAGYDTIVQWAEKARFSNSCSPANVMQLLEKFLIAFRQGDQVELVQLFDFSPIADFPPQYQIYGVREKESLKSDFQARDLDSLLAYFAERHKHSEQFSLLTLQLSEFWHKEMTNLSFSLLREADDVGAYRKVEGTGAIHCFKQKIITWLMLVS